MTPCPKCQGLLVFSEYSDQSNTFLVTRCLNCGRLTDRIANQNKLLPLPKPWLDISTNSRRPRHVRTGQMSQYDAKHAQGQR